MIRCVAYLRLREVGVFRLDASTPSAKYEIFIQVVLSCLIIFTPEVRFVDTTKYKNPVPWWDEECNRVKE